MRRAVFDKSSERLKPWRLVSASALSLVLVFGQTAPVLGNPTGGNVAAGSASIGGAGNTVTINQASSTAIINWQTFSINSGETTKFLVPTSSSATLNRVLGGNPSEIFGTLQSNGQLFLINPSGIVVGAGGRIDTAGFLGSTLDVSNDQFLKGGNLNFLGTSGAGVDNAGTINATGGSVYLIANQVNNSGTINAPQGNVGLAAGTDILFQQAGDQHLFVQPTPTGTTRAAGVTNAGTIRAASAELKAAGGNAYALAINNTGQIAATGYKKVNGQVYLTSEGGNISNSGTISAQQANGNGGTIVLNGHGTTAKGTALSSGKLIASGKTKGAKGGTVEVLGNQVGITGTGVVDVSGDTGGGTALIGGDEHGANPAVPNADQTYLGPEAQILADSLTLGNGGKVILWGDLTTQAYGQISAQGGPQGGNGGFVETSGATLDARTAPNLSAPHGTPGTWLLDPSTVTISDTATDSGYSSTPAAFTISSGAASISQTALLAALETGNVTIDANQGSGGNGTITWTQSSTPFDIKTLTGTTPTLTLDAPGLMQLSGITIDSSNGSGSLNLVLNSSLTGAGQVSIGGSTIALNGGTLTANGNGYTSTSDSNGIANGINIFNSTINAQGGNINLTGTGGYISTTGSSTSLEAGFGVGINNEGTPCAIGTTGTGNINITGTFSQNITSTQGNINAVNIYGSNQTISVVHGTITINGTVSSGTFGDGTAFGDINGVEIGAGSLVEATGSGGSISITGNTTGSTVYDASSGSNYNIGVGISGSTSPNTIVSVGTNGTLTLNGTAGTVSSNFATSAANTGDALGISLGTSAQLTAGTGGSISITGTGGSAVSSSAYTGSADGVSIGGDNGNGGIAQVTAATGGSISITGYGGGINTSGASDPGSNSPSAQGVNISHDTNITANGTATILITGYGGTVTSGGTLFGNAIGVDVGSESSASGNPVISSASGTLEIDGYGGSTPNLGLGVVIHGFDGGLATVESTTGNITFTGIGASGYTGSGFSVGYYVPSIGVAVVDNVTVSTGGTLTITGTGGSNGAGASNAFGISIGEIVDSTIDPLPSPPTITAGGALTLTDLSSTGIYLHDVTVNAASYLDGSVESTPGPVDIENSTITLTGGDFVATGTGNTTLDPNGVTIISSTINAGGGNVNLTGTANYIYSDGLSGNIAGEGILVDSSTLQTSGTGGMNWDGDASLGVTVLNSLRGVHVEDSTLTVVDGLIHIVGTVNSGTALATATAATDGFGGDGVEGIEINNSLSTTSCDIQATGTGGSIALIGDASGSTSDASDTTSSNHDSYGISIHGSSTEVVSAGNALAFIDSSDNSFYGICIEGESGDIINNQTLSGGGDGAGATGLDIGGGSNIKGTGAASVTLVGLGGSNSTLSGAVVGSAAGVEIGSNGTDNSPDNGNTRINSASGTISITGFGGVSPNKGMGVGIEGKNGSSTSIISGSGNIALTGTGGSGNNGNGGAKYLPDYGVIVADDTTVQTGGAGMINFTGTGSGSNNAGVEIAKLSSSVDSAPVSPQIITGTTSGVFNITTTSGSVGTDIVVDNATVTAGSGAFSSAGEVIIVDSNLTWSGAFTASGYGTANNPNIDLSGTIGGPFTLFPDGIWIGNSVINAQGGTISLTGQASSEFYNFGVVPGYGSSPLSGYAAGVGVAVESSTLETTGTGQINIIGHGGVSGTVLDDLNGVEITQFNFTSVLGGSTLSTVNGLISIKGDVDNGTATDAPPLTTGNGVAGVTIDSASIVQATGTGGSIAIIGNTSGSTSDATYTGSNSHDNNGVRMHDATITSAGNGLAYTDNNDNTFNGIYIQGTADEVSNNQVTGPTGNQNDSSANGVSIDHGTTIQGTGSTAITMVGQGGYNSTLGGAILGSAIGVAIASDSSSNPANTLVETNTGNITITGTGGTSPNAGIGVVVGGFDSGYTAKLLSATGTITLTGTGASGNSGPPATLNPNVTYGPNVGVAVLGAAVLQTGGSGGIGVSLNGTGMGQDGAAVYVSQFGLATSPVITSPDGEVDANGSGGDIVFSNTSQPASPTFTAPCLDFTTNGEGAVVFSNVNFLLSGSSVKIDGAAIGDTVSGIESSYTNGIEIDNSFINSQGGAYSLTGYSSYLNNGSGNVAGAGVLINNSVLETASVAQSSTITAGDLNITGYGDTSVAAINSLTGVNIISSTLSIVGGTATIDGYVDTGTSPVGVLGINITNSSVVEASSGTVNLTGTNASSTSAPFNAGVFIISSGVASGGSSGLTISGTSGTVTGASSVTVDGITYNPTSVGILLSGGAQLNATGTGPVDLTGAAGPNNSTALSTAYGGTYGVSTDAFSGSPEQITSTGGGISITGTAGSGSGTLFNDGIYLGPATVQDAGTGAVTLMGTGGLGQDDNTGVVIEGATTVRAGSGASSGLLTITGNGVNGVTGQVNQGVTLFSGAQAISGSGGIKITGTAPTGGTDYNYGLSLSGATIKTSGGGAITLKGTAAGTGIDNQGFSAFSVSKVTSNTGDISITGIATAGGSSFNAGLTVDDSTVSTGGAGTLTLNGTSAGGSDYLNEGVSISYGASLTTGQGLISITGDVTGAAPNGGIGVDVSTFAASGSAISISSTTGSVTINGTGGTGNTGSSLDSNPYAANAGIRINDASTLSGVNLTLTGSGSGVNATGVDISPNLGSTLPTLTVSGALSVTSNAGIINYNPSGGGTTSNSFTTPLGTTSILDNVGSSLSLSGGDFDVTQTTPLTLEAVSVDGLIVASSSTVTLTGTATATTSLSLSGSTVSTGAATVISPLVVLNATGAITLGATTATTGIGLASSGNGDITQAGALTTQLLTVTAAGQVTLNNTGNNITYLGAITHTGAVDIYTDPGLTLVGLISGNAPVLIQEIGGDLTIGPTGQISSGGSLVTLVTNDYFINDSTQGSNAVGNNYYIYSSDPSATVLGGITPDFTLFNVTYPGSGFPSGNGVLYAYTTPPSPPPSNTGSTGNTVPPAVTPQNNQINPQQPPPGGFNTESDNSVFQPVNYTGNGTTSQTGQQGGDLADTSGNGGTIGSGDAAQLNGGGLNNVSNPAAAGALNQALGAAVHDALANALQALGDYSAANYDTSGGSGTGTGGTNEKILGGGDVVQIGGGGGVQSIPLNQAPQPLQNALGNGVRDGLSGAGH